MDHDVVGVTTNEPRPDGVSPPKSAAETGRGGRAYEVTRLFSPYRLQVARQARSMNRTELGNRIGISAAAVSQFEGTHVRPSPATVERIASALDFPLEFFSTASVV